jgi:hypothetical protein
MNRTKRFIGALSVAGMLVGVTELPASATTPAQAYAVHHCTQWEVDGIMHHMADFWHQVHLLSGPAVLHRVRTPAIALLGSDTAANRTALDNACWTVPGMGQ